MALSRYFIGHGYRKKSGILKVTSKSPSSRPVSTSKSTWKEMTRELAHPGSRSPLILSLWRGWRSERAKINGNVRLSPWEESSNSDFQPDVTALTTNKTLIQRTNKAKEPAPWVTRSVWWSAGKRKFSRSSLNHAIIMLEPASATLRVESFAWR